METLALVITVVAIVAVLCPVLRLLVLRIRCDVRRYRAERRARRSSHDAETRARALMSELCPHGWRCEITLLDGVAAEDPGHPSGRVALDWAELPAGSDRPSVVRRVWADSVSDALQAMVADRRTDAALEQIELRATLDGAHWPDA